jgi:hypothetical protein
MTLLSLPKYPRRRPFNPSIPAFFTQEGETKALRGTRSF